MGSLAPPAAGAACHTVLSAGVEEVILMSQILVLLAASVERGHTLAQSKWITQSSAGGVILMVKVPFLQSFSSHI